MEPSGFDEVTRASQEASKAIQEASKTSGKAIDAVHEAGSFIAEFIRGPLVQAVGMWEDKLAYARWERQQRLMMKAKQFMKEHGLEHPTRPVPLNVAIPLLQAGSIEEDDELQDIWARLLVNAGDAKSGIDVKRSYISILQDFTRLESHILSMLYNIEPEGCTVLSDHLPDKAEPYLSSADSVQHRLPPIPVQIALWNLNRLGCITFNTALADGADQAFNVAITPLGTALVRACTLGRTRRN